MEGGGGFSDNIYLRLSFSSLYCLQGGKKGRHLMSVEGGKSIKNGLFHCIVQHGSRMTILLSLSTPCHSSITQTHKPHMLLYNNNNNCIHPSIARKKKEPRPHHPPWLSLCHDNNQPESQFNRSLLHNHPFCVFQWGGEKVLVVESEGC